HLSVAELHGLLLERAQVLDGERVEQRDAGDGRHGRHGEVVHHRVRHDALHEPLPRPFGCSGLQLLGSGWCGIRACRCHLVAAGRTLDAAHVRHVVETVVGAAAEEALGLRRRRGRQAEDGGVGAGRRREHDGAEQRVLGGAGLDVGAVELLDAGVEVADAADHGVLPEQLDGRADRQRQEGEEEVDDILARLREQHSLGIGVDEQLHA
ncbi:Os01g0153550, partial [Oryza sativa Japonica Group]